MPRAEGIKYEKISHIAILALLITVFCGGCVLIDGEHMTTERIQQKVDNRYGSGGAKVKQIDSNNWEVALTAYPEIIYTMKENIGIGSVVPVPEYKLSDNRMEKEGAFVGPNYFTLEEIRTTR